MIEPILLRLSPLDFVQKSLFTTSKPSNPAHASTVQAAYTTLSINSTFTGSTVSTPRQQLRSLGIIIL